MASRSQQALPDATDAQRLCDAADGLDGGRVTLQSLADAHGPSTRETLLVLLGALCILPVPGVGTVLGLGIVALSVVMQRGHAGVALPSRVARADVSRELGRRVLRLLARFHTVAAQAFRPRLQRLVSGSDGRTTAALAGLMGALIALPFPFGNFFPSLALIYDAVLGTLGVPAGAVDRHRVFRRTPTGVFSVTVPIDGQPATLGNGTTIGFACQSADQADAWHIAGLANGGTACEDPPGEREGPTAKLYIAYLRDPDGNKICALYRMPRNPSV